MYVMQRFGACWKWGRRGGSLRLSSPSRSPLAQAPYAVPRLLIAYSRWCLSAWLLLLLLLACGVARSLGGKLLELATGGIVTANGSGGGKLDAPLGSEESIQLNCVTLAGLVRSTLLHNLPPTVSGKDGDDDAVLSDSSREDLVAMEPHATTACVMDRMDKWLDSAAVKEVEAWKAEMKRKVRRVVRRALSISPPPHHHHSAGWLSLRVGLVL